MNRFPSLAGLSVKVSVCNQSKRLLTLDSGDRRVGGKKD